MSLRWSGGRLIAASAVLTCAGTLLLYVGLQPQVEPGVTAYPGSTPSVAVATSLSGPAAARSGRTGSGSAGVRPSAPAPTATIVAAPSGLAAVRAELPHPGSGEAADPLIQQALDRASRPDLPGRDEALLLRQGRQAWLTDTHAYTQVRLQAATVRRASADGEEPVRAVVRLVWAGADPAGTFLDGRPAAVHFTQNGDGSWNRTG
ncbi:hypothetical protein [Streptomyces sp. NPDC089799]|uniref:hypothetical protein n=1 Tax=Streptomyces sp. NPDC089799 TaxID=3155066 RepID=UPI00343693DD